MRITDVQVDGFGVWTGLQIDDLSQKLTVFFGPNEAGKTTLMQFVRSVLYGFSPQRRQRYLPPLHGGKAGGCLSVASGKGTVQIRRHTHQHDRSDSVGEVSVVAADGTVQGQHLLASLLADVDEPIFNNVFAVGLRDLQELGTLNETEAADLLYKLTSGLDRVSLVDVISALQSSRNRILASDGSRSQIGDLRARRDQLRRELEELAAGGRAWSQLAADREAAKEQASHLERGIAQVEHDARVVEIALQVAKPWTERQQLEQQLAQLVPADVSEEVIERLDQCNRWIDQRRGRVEEVKRQRRQIREEAAAQPINRQLWAQAARIEALAEHAPWISSLESQIQALQPEVEQLEAALKAKSDRLGVPLPEMTGQLPEISRPMLQALRTPARLVRDEQRRLSQAQQDRDRSWQEVQNLSQQLETGLAHRSTSDLIAAVEEAGQRVSLLRRRIQLEERMDKMRRHQKELDEDVVELMDEQVMPLPKLLWLGVPFVLGVTLILGGLFWPASAMLGWPVALLGLGGLSVGVVMKFMLERSASSELTECQRQQDLLHKQQQQARKERDELDRQIPTGGGQLDSRLNAAQVELEELEKLLPLDADLKAVRQRCELAEQREKQATAGLQQARQRWRTALRRLQLPEALSPKQIRDLAESSQQNDHGRRQLTSRREELEGRQRELVSLARRIEQVFAEVQLVPQTAEPQSQLTELTAALADQRQLFQRRAALRRQDRQLRREQEKIIRGMEKMQNRREALLLQTGVESEEQLRQLCEQQLQYRSLKTQCDQLSRQIQTVVGTHVSQAAIDQALQSSSQNELDRHWEQLVAQLQDSQSRLSATHQRLGELSQEMKMLAEDRRVAQLQLELACVDQQLQHAIQHWQVLAVTSLLLETICEIYETQRQPETLSEASTYLHQFTRGQYTRIWTPLDKNVLRLDDAHGQSLPLEVLSRGTREAVFLSLRLALVAAYARRGAVLPIVLDDVLVNLDVPRAKAAVSVLRNFAKQGHQLLLFTCHEHIVKLFRAAKVEIRNLPSHAEIGLTQDDPQPTALPEKEPGDEALADADEAEELGQEADELEEVQAILEEEDVEAEEDAWEEDDPWDEDDDDQEDVEEDTELDEDEDVEYDDEDYEEEYEDEYEDVDDYEDEEYDDDDYEQDEEEDYEEEEAAGEDEHEAISERPEDEPVAGANKRELPPQAGPEPTETAKAVDQSAQDEEEDDREQLFTWESPEMWWNESKDDAA